MATRKCIDCGEPTGKAVQAKRCAACKVVFARLASAIRGSRYYRENPAKFLARGANAYYNVVPACHACNSAKQARTLMFMAKRGYLGAQNAS